MVRQLTEVQFQAFPHLPRPDVFDSIIEEHEWYSDDEEHTLGVVFRDKTDNDWAYVILQLGADSFFKCVTVGSSFRDQKSAREILLSEIELVSRSLKEARTIGRTAKRIPEDLFVPIVSPSKLNPLFRIVANLDSYTPARGMIGEVFDSYEDYDGNFVEQFQTTGFDSRIWELYLHAYLTNSGFTILPSVSPDFVVSKEDQTIGIEAVTANPTQGPIEDQSQEVYSSTRLVVPPFDSKLPKLDGAFDYKQEDFVPIKLGSALYSKLNKRYWELPNMCDKPIILAIETFHEEAALHYSSTALGTYVYGFRHSYMWDTDGNLMIVPQKVDSHVFGGKSIPSGFFFQPEACHVSAVLFSNSGTVSKFNRLGQQGSYHNPRIRLIRFGDCYNPDPNAATPLPFVYEVGDPDYLEWWGQGLEMFHNPVALHPVDRALFPEITHHRFEHGVMYTQPAFFQPFASMTLNTTASWQASRLLHRLRDLL